MDRKKTIQSYTSRINILREFIKQKRPDLKYANQLDKAFFTAFFDWLHEEREVSNQTHNNYATWCVMFGQYLTDRDYADENPASHIKKLRPEPKHRQALTPEQLRQLIDHIKQRDRYFLLAVYMEYYMFIRPTELSKLKIGDFNVADKTVFVSSKVSKNKYDSYVTVNDTILKLMVDLEIFAHPSDEYLFSKGMRPGKQYQWPYQFSNRWNEFRKELGWGDELQFYSLKDSGIRDLAEERGIVTARDQARHQDISTTNKYLSSSKGKAPAKARGFRGSLDDQSRTR